MEHKHETGEGGKGVTTVTPKITVKVFNDSWQLELIYSIPSTTGYTPNVAAAAAAAAAATEKNNKQQSGGMLKSLEQEGKLCFWDFPLTVPSLLTDTGYALSLPNTACNIRVTCTDTVPSGGSVPEAGNTPEKHQRVQHLVISNPLLKSTRVVALNNSKDGTLPLDLVKGDVVGVYDDAVVLTNIQSNGHEEGDSSFIGHDFTVYLKTKNYILLGDSPKEKKVVFECKSPTPPYTQKTISVYFDIAFIYNATLEYNSLLDLRTDAHHLVDGRGFFLPRPSLKECNNTGKNLLMSCITEGNQKLREQYNKSWFIDHTLTLKSTPELEGDYTLGDSLGRLETSVVLKPNSNLPCEYASLARGNSNIILVPGYNLSPTYRKIVKRVTLSVPADSSNSHSSDTNNNESYSRSNNKQRFVRHGGSGPTARMTAVVECETSSSVTTSSAAPPFLESEEPSSGQKVTTEIPLYGTPLKAKRHLLSRTQNVHYRLGELEVKGKDLKLCGWRFPSEQLVQEYQKPRVHDKCEVLNVIVLKGTKVFERVKSGPLTTIDQFGTRIKVTDYPQRRIDVDGNDEEEEDAYYRPNDDIIVSSFNSGMVLHQSTCHFFLPSPEKIKVTRRLVDFSSSTRAIIGETGGDDVSVITATYEVNVKHSGMRKNEDHSETIGERNSEVTNVDPYLLLLVVHNSTQVSVEYTVDPSAEKLIFQPFGTFLRNSRQDSRKELNGRFAQQYPHLRECRREMEKFFSETSYNMFNYNVNSGGSYTPNQVPFSDFVVCSVPITKNEVLRVQVSLEKVLNVDRRR